MLRSIRVRRLLRGLLPLLLLLRPNLRSLCWVLRRKLGRHVPRWLLLPLLRVRSRRVRDSAPRTRGRVLLRRRWRALGFRPGTLWQRSLCRRVPRILRRQMVHAVLPHPHRHCTSRPMVTAVPRSTPLALHVPRRVAPAPRQPSRQPIPHLDPAQRGTAWSRWGLREAARRTAAAPTGSPTTPARGESTTHRATTSSAHRSSHTTNPDP